MLLPLSFRFQKWRIHFSHGGDGSVEAFGEGFAGQFVEQRLGIKEVEVTGSALHKEKNDVFGLSPAMRNLGKGGVRGSLGKQRLFRQCGKSDCPEPCSCSGKEVPAIEGVVDSITSHTQWR